MKRLKVLVYVLLVVEVTSCIPKSVQQKRDELCTDLVTLDEAIAELSAVSDSATVRALKQAEVRVTRAFRAVQASAEEVSETDIDELETAYTELDDAVDDLSEESTIAQAVAKISGKLVAAQSAVARAQTDLRCPE